ncbi:MAG: hypothetical protein AAF901_09670 [Bacteroidota bacterium]
MNKNLITSTLLILIVFSLNAQQEVIRENDRYRNRGYFNITQFGYIFVNEATLETFSPEDGVTLIELPSSNAGAFGLHTINGYFFNPYLSIGLGLGIDGYTNPTYNTIPLYIDFRGYLTDGLGSPYAFVDYGTLIKIKNGPQNGNMFNVGIGYKVPLNQSRFIIVGDLSYSYKAVSNDGEPIRTSESYVRLKGIMLSVGVMF